MIEIARQKTIEVLDQIVYAVINRQLVVRVGTVQDKIGHALCEVEAARVAYAQACSPEFGTAQVGVYVFEAIVAGMAPALLDFQLPGQQIELVVGNQDFVCLQFEETRHGTHRLTGKIHVGVGNQQKNIVAVFFGFCKTTGKMFFELKWAIKLLCQLGKQPGTRVVAGVFVLRARIAQARNESDWSLNHPGLFFVFSGFG